MNIGRIGDCAAKALGKISYLKPVKALGRAFEKDPEKALAWATVGSIIAKDGVGCAMYVYQSLNNKRIPDEKRKFVAALDLTNGGLMIAAQIAMFLLSRAYSGALFKKLFGKSFSAAAKSNTISRIRMLAAKAGKNVDKKLKIGKVFDKVEKSSLDVFKFVFDTASATIIGKRVIVPLIATPMAKKVENWLGKKAGEPTENDENANSATTDTSVMTDKDESKTSQPQDFVLNEADVQTNLLKKYQQQNNK